MSKKLLCLAAAFLLALCGSAFAEGEPQPATGEEMAGLLSSVLEKALSAKPVNDPAAEEARSEDGTRFQFENVSLYASGTEITPDTPVNVIQFTDSEGDVLRSTGIDTQWIDLLAAYPLDNPDLRGTREAAVLYLRKTENGGFTFGRVLRDGQRIRAAEYGEVIPEGDLYRTVSVTYSLQDGLVTSIRVDGINPETAPAADAARAAEAYAELETLLDTDEYRAVKTSRNGTELAAFGPEDLEWNGVRFTALQPETLPGAPETELIDNEDGTWLLRCDGDGYEAVFLCGEGGSDPRILSYSILDEDAEGPRCVRLGDLFSDDYCRFRSEGNEPADSMTELLYGQAGTAPWGQAAYDYAGGEVSLRYVTEADGREVELLLRYVQNRLAEIIIHTL